MSNSDEVATAGEGNSPSPSLSEAQRAAFWAGIRSNTDIARRTARKFVSRQDVDDVVHTATVFFFESLQGPKKPARFPSTDDEFRRRFLIIVRNHAIDCVRDYDGSECPTHSQWGVVREPVVGGRKVADRALERDFARNDKAKYDAPAPEESRPDDDVDHLHFILLAQLPDLPEMQRKVIEQTFLEGRKRAEIARRLRISVKTYDNHLQAAFRSLRRHLRDCADVLTGLDRSRWYDIIEALSDRYEATRLRRTSGKKGERSNVEGERSDLEGERNKKLGEGAA